MTIPTANRPVGLDRCIRSYQKGFQKFDRPVEFFVVDNSESREVRTQNQTILKNFKNELAAKVVYCDPEERTKYLAKIQAESGVPLEVLSFALTESDVPWRTAAPSLLAIRRKNPAALRKEWKVDIIDLQVIQVLYHFPYIIIYYVHNRQEHQTIQTRQRAFARQAL
jgi:hypothetical protein